MQTSLSARNLRIPPTSGHMTQSFFVPLRVCVWVFGMVAVVVQRTRVFCGIGQCFAVCDVCLRASCARVRLVDRSALTLSLRLPKKVMEPQGIRAKVEFIMDMCRKELEAMGDISHEVPPSIPEERVVRTAESLPILSEAVPSPVPSVEATDDAAAAVRVFTPIFHLFAPSSKRDDAKTKCVYVFF